MKNRTYFIGLSVALMALSLPSAFAQDEEPTLPATEEPVEVVAVEPEIPAGQEVEINEDNYRQFMELKDALRQRDIIPENVFKPGSGLQKLDKLPEASQKHLRNQLREIIVQGDPWQPGDEETEYPYTPSAAASTDPSLEKQEREAWGELVDSYHDRESQIYENSSGSQAARGSEQGSSDSTENGAGSTGQAGQNGEASQGQQPGSGANPDQSNPDKSNAEGTYSLNGNSDPGGNSTAGVSQNAMEFLQGLGAGGSNPQGALNGSETGEPGQGSSQTPSTSQVQAQTGQQGAATAGTQGPNSGPANEGSSQNAMEFLQGLANDGETSTGNGTEASTNTEQQRIATTPSGTSSSNPSQAAPDPDTNSTEGTSQNALEFLNATTGDSGDSQADSQQTDQQLELSGDQVSDQKNDQPSDQDGSQKNGEALNDQQSEELQESASSIQDDNTSSDPDAETEEESTAGTAQNALEYLLEESAQDEDGMDAEPDTGQPSGTLSIQDLLNARGTGNSSSSEPEPAESGKETQADKKTPDKDKDG